jgi:hypothetical protein
MENYISQLEQEKMSLEREVSMNIFKFLRQKILTNRSFLFFDSSMVLMSFQMQRINSLAAMSKVNNSRIHETQRIKCFINHSLWIVFCVRQVSELKVSRQMIEKKAEEDMITAMKVTNQKAEEDRYYCYQGNQSGS